MPTWTSPIFSPARSSFTATCLTFEYQFLDDFGNVTMVQIYYRQMSNLTCIPSGSPGRPPNSGTPSQMSVAQGATSPNPARSRYVRRCSGTELRPAFLRPTCSRAWRHTRTPSPRPRCESFTAYSPTKDRRGLRLTAAHVPRISPERAREITV